MKTKHPRNHEIPVFKGMIPVLRLILFLFCYFEILFPHDAVSAKTGPGPGKFEEGLISSKIEYNVCCWETAILQSRQPF